MVRSEDEAEDVKELATRATLVERISSLGQYCFDVVELGFYNVEWKLN
jgi:hypothetical protein